MRLSCRYSNCMAREPSETGVSSESDDSRARAGRHNGILNRRSYLKLAGTAAAGLAASAAVGTAAASEGYEVIEIPANTHDTIFVRSGETFENKIIDVSAEGAQCSINSRNETNWTSRNIGFRGLADGGAFFGVSDTGGGTSRMENIYIGDGTVPGHRSGLGIFVGGEHNGTIEMDRIYIEGMGDNSFYCSSATDGEVHISNCYSKNSWVTHYRLTHGSVTNCVGVTDQSPRSRDSPNHEGRAVWTWEPGEVEVRDCHFVNEGRFPTYVTQQNAVTNVYDTQHTGSRLTGGDGTTNLRSGNGSSPRDFVPEGCPTSPEEAASGDGSSGDSGGERDDSLEHAMTFDGEGEYYWQVHDGPIEPVEGGERMWVSENGRYAAGVLEDGEEHQWAYDSFLADIEVEDGVDATINGEHTPTWELYPDDDADSRDWYDDVPW